MDASSSLVVTELLVYRGADINAKPVSVEQFGTFC